MTDGNTDFKDGAELDDSVIEGIAGGANVDVHPAYKFAACTKCGSKNTEPPTDHSGQYYCNDCKSYFRP